MLLHPYQGNDLAALAGLFFETVHEVNARDYTPQQLWAWATGEVDREEWDRTLREHHSLVAVEGERIVGFGDMDATGYLDRLYVHKDHQAQGIATALCDALEHHGAATGLHRFTTHASITAQPFFAHRGYQTLEEQQVERLGILLTNYHMEKGTLLPRERGSFLSTYRIRTTRPSFLGAASGASPSA